MKLIKPKFWDNDKISFFSIFLLPLSILFQFVNLVRSTIVKEKKYSIPIICVGNIYLGGTGKTPLCTEIYNILQNLKKRPVFIKKKYVSHFDEVHLLKSIGPIQECYKRKEALDKAIQNNFEIAILDDGFQDFTVKKDLNIVCFNETQWIGNSLIMPSGPLRESLSALKRANYVVINGKKNIKIENKILEKNKLIEIFYTQYKPQNLEKFKSKKIICFAGIGNPINFFNLLEENKLDVLEKIIFPDHYNYSKKELDNLIEKATKNNTILLTTEKDYFRLDEEYKKKISYLKIKVEISNVNKFIEGIKKII